VDTQSRHPLFQHSLLGLAYENLSHLHISSFPPTGVA
jgi:hypothetical protein